MRFCRRSRTLDLVDAFSIESEQGEADMTELVNDGAVFLVNLPMTKYGREGARFAYLLVNCAS